MDNILAIVLSSAVLTTIITKLFNDHDRKKNHFIEEAKERRNALCKILKQLETTKKYNKKTKHILADLKLYLNGYGRCSSIGDKSALLRDTHIWREIEKLEKECEKYENADNSKECFEKNKEKLLQYVSCLVEYQTEIIKKEITTSYYNVALVVVLFIPAVFAVYGLWDINIKISGSDIVYSVVILVMVYILLQIPVIVEKVSIDFISTRLCEFCWVVSFLLYIGTFFCVLSKYTFLFDITSVVGMVSIVMICIFMAGYNWQTHVINAYRIAVANVDKNNKDGK